MCYYEGNKEKNLRLFKLKFAHTFNDVHDNLFKEVFGLTSVKLADKTSLNVCANFNLNNLRFFSLLPS